MTLYFSKKLQALGVINATTGRRQGNMRLPENAHHLFSTYNLPQEKILRFKQIHSDQIIPILSESQAQRVTTEPLIEADAWVLSTVGFAAAILTADCAPLIVWDKQAKVLGLAHCGWRGVAAGLPAKIISKMKAAAAKEPLSAWIGPHIQSCCFEVQSDVAAQFAPYIETRNGKLFVDLNQAILQQLTEQGLSIDEIEFCPHCTCCEPENFFSFRRDHTKDALLSFVYKPAVGLAL